MDKITKVIVVTPLKLRDGDFGALAKKIGDFLVSKSLVSGKASFVQETDSAILGGFKAKVGSIVLDLSLSGKIEKEIGSK